jgi:hypothetical protein
MLFHTKSVRLKFDFSLSGNTLDLAFFGFSNKAVIPDPIHFEQAFD